jgi:glycerate kinase
VGVLAGRLGELRKVRVSGPLDRAVDAEWVLDPRSATAYLECAQACGLALLDGPPTPQTAVAMHSRGVGQLMAAALGAGAERIGSDPLLGPIGAARVFGPQKGGDPATVALLEDRLTGWGPSWMRPLGVRSARRPGPAPQAGSGSRCWHWAGGGNRVRRSSPSTPTSPTMWPPPNSSSPVRAGSTTRPCTARWVSALASGARARGTPVRVRCGGPSTMRRTS